MANASDDRKAKVVINHMSAEYIKAYSHHFVQQRNSQKRYAVTQSDLAIKNELLYYLSNHTHSRILDTSDVNFWRHKEEKTTKWISKHSRQNTNSNEPPLDDLLVIRACAAFQALTDCLRHWEGDKVLSENKLQVIFERTFYPELFDPIPEDEDEKKTFMRSYDSKRGAKMSHGSMQNCFNHMLEFITGYKRQEMPKTTTKKKTKKKTTKKRKRNNNKKTTQKKSKTSDVEPKHTKKKRSSSGLPATGDGFLVFTIDGNTKSFSTYDKAIVEALAVYDQIRNNQRR